MIKVCSNGGATYIIGEIIAKDNLNIENLMQTFENLLLQNYSTKFLDIALLANNSQRQFEHRKFDANLLRSSSPKLLNKILRYYIQIDLGYVQL